MLDLLAFFALGTIIGVGLVIVLIMFVVILGDNRNEY